MGLELFASQSAGALGTLVTGWVPELRPHLWALGWLSSISQQQRRPWQHPGHSHTVLKGPGHRAGARPTPLGGASLCRQAGTLFTGGAKECSLTL